MFQSKDGRKFGSAFVAKRRDAEHEKSKLPMGETKEEPRTNPFGEGKSSANEATAPDNDVKTSPEGVDPQQVVAEHGKATTVHVAHDHKNNKHKVVSTHESGHVHESDHASPKEAHVAASALAGGGEQPAAEQENEGPEADGFTMPRLA